MIVTTPDPTDQEDEEMLVPPSDLVEGPQPMEAQAETGNSIENQQVEDPQTSRFTWRIENFSRLNTKKLYSEFFVLGGYKWRILIFPKGNNVDHLSMYLDVADSTNLPYGWVRNAQFSLAIVNQIDNKYSVRKDTQHQFNARESDWGFTSFMPISELYDPGKGYLLNDTCLVEAEFAVHRVVDYWTYDSKKETGFVGLKNQGATGYMNSLLQILYHFPYFRKAVYHMPTTENDITTASIPLALQSLFYKLQYSDSSVATKELTKSFGWDTYDSFMQHDVQELNRVLCEKLEDKMKGTVVEGTIRQLFEGHHMNYIECINVDYKSTRKESFYDLQLDVKGCRDVYASFDKYVEVECLEGYKYHTEQYGLQDAKKGVLFIDFPPVLQLQLKRFEYDFMRDTTVKINDRYEFPLQLDLDRENGKYLSPEANRSIRNLYTLHSVVVHSGGANDGRQYAFIRPTLSDQWYKFDDEMVTKEDMKRALEEQYGGEEELPQTNPGFNNTPFKFTKYSNAYMLVYIRESDKEKIICNVDEKDIAEHLREKLKREQEEKETKKKEKAEARLYTIIKVASNEDLVEQIGKDRYFDLVDHDKVRSFRIQKQMPFNLFKKEVAKEFGIPVQFQRFWLWARRQNHTYRPNRPLTHLEETQTVGQLRETSNKVNNAELKLFLEVETGLDLRPIPPPDKTKDDILLFFKLYDPEKEELCYVGRLFVKAAGKPTEILTKLNEMAGSAPDEEISLYEEIKFEPHVMCEPIDKKISFRCSQLEDGDIVCFQKSLPVKSCNQIRYPDVPSFLEYAHNRQVVHFRPLEKPKEDDFCLELSKLHTYDDVVERVAQQLGLVDSSKIRLTSHNCYSQQPKPHPIKYRGVDHLSDMLVHYNQTSDILYYEVLDIPLPELQGLKTLKVAFHHATKDEVSVHTIRLPKQSTVGDVINELKKKVELSHPNAELKLLEVFYHKIYKIFPASEKIENINDQYWTLRAEEILEEEKNLSPHDRLIHVYHFTKETARNQMQQIQNFGEPFFLVIHERETLADVKVRIQKKLQVPDDEFAEWKFAFLSLGQPEYLHDSDVVSCRFQRICGAWEPYLGLEHPIDAPKRAYAANQEIELSNKKKGVEPQVSSKVTKRATSSQTLPKKSPNDKEKPFPQKGFKMKAREKAISTIPSIPTSSCNSNSKDHEKEASEKEKSKESEKTAEEQTEDSKESDEEIITERIPLSPSSVQKSALTPSGVSERPVDSCSMTDKEVDIRKALLGKALDVEILVSTEEEMEEFMSTPVPEHRAISESSRNTPVPSSSVPPEITKALSVLTQFLTMSFKEVIHPSRRSKLEEALEVLKKAPCELDLPSTLISLVLQDLPKLSKAYEEYSNEASQADIKIQKHKSLNAEISTVKEAWKTLKEKISKSLKEAAAFDEEMVELLATQEGLEKQKAEIEAQIASTKAQIEKTKKAKAEKTNQTKAWNFEKLQAYSLARKLFDEVNPIVVELPTLQAIKESSQKEQSKIEGIWAGFRDSVQKKD